MRYAPAGLSAVAVVFAICSPSGAVQPTAAEMARAREWMAARFGEAPSIGPPFSFTYGGRPSSELLKTWTVERQSRKLEGARTEYLATWTDPTTGLVLTCRTLAGENFPTVEWTLHLKNTGSQDTPILADIQALDAVFGPKGADAPLLHHFRGDNCTKDSFEPLRTTLAGGSDRRFAPAGGRPSSGEWPYYNLEWNGGGIMLAIGWPGQWACRFSRKQDEGVQIRAGQELTHFTLHPGEEVRTPLIALMFYERDWIGAQNLWRRWMLAENFPKEHGESVSPKLAGFAGNFFPGYRTDRSEIDFIDGYLQEEIKLDYWWIDTGWYPGKGDWFQSAGTWEVDKSRFPKGIREVSDHARVKGMQFILWFEPERAGAGTWLAENHPEWIIGGKNGGLLNLGNSEAWHWIVERIDSLIVSEGVDVYRQDFNMDPLGSWRGNDTPDRQGITEIKHVEGYLAFWDELRRRHPDMLIDSCASGGRRNDLETMRRAVPFLRSDYCTDADGTQCHTYGFNMWLPYYRGATDKIDAYDFRSNFSPLMMVVWDTRKKDLDYASARKLVEQWRNVAPCFAGDFYPLTDYSVAGNVWMAFQFDHPSGSAGLVQAFRRAECPDETVRVKLRGLEPQATYTLTNPDEAGSSEMTGRELCERGLLITLKSRPGAAIVNYAKRP